MVGSSVAGHRMFEDAGLTVGPRYSQQSGNSPAAAQLDGLKSQRSELMSQLTSLTIRRDLLNQQLRNASGQSAADLQAQLRSIDQSVKQTTSDLDRIDQAAHKAVIASTDDGSATSNPLAAVDLARMIQGAINSSTTSDPRVHNLERVVVGLGALNGLGIVLMLVLLWRTMRWPRSNERSLGDDVKLDQLQRAVDVIAVEVERISEAQRFTAKLAGTPGQDANVAAGLSRPR